MDECRTPTIPSPSIYTTSNTSEAVFKYPVVQNGGLTVSQAFGRCYTPNLNDFKSPGLSPIADQCTYNHKECTPTVNPESREVKKPRPCLGQSPSATQANSNILNKHLEVESVLCSVGLQKYCKIFRERGIDFPKLLQMKRDDLLKIGVQTEEDCSVMIDFLQDLNSSK